jgi:phosphomannomutase/phosphoglucomutase
LLAALAQGLQAGGLDVIDLGEVATPMVYFAVHELNTGTGVMLTGSHNPPDYNGLKMVIGNEAIHGATIQDLRRRINCNQLAQGAGSYRQENIAERYVQRIVGDVKLSRPIKLAIDCGNGVPGAYAPALFRALGCEVTELFCEVDGHFPNHHPDPAHIENLHDLMRCLRDTDDELGFAFDGDGDRLGVVTKDGQVIFPDRQMMLFARDILSRQPGAEIIYDVKCSRLLGDDIRRAGGRPLMWKTGHSLVKAKLKETGAPLAGEMSGHIFFKERWYGFDDGLYAGARLLEIVSRAPDANAVLNALPNSSATPELHLHCAEGENHTLIERLQREVTFPLAREVITIDGVRAEYADGFGLARASNTTPVVVLRFEADNAAALARIQQTFKHALLGLKPDAVLPF